MEQEKKNLNVEEKARKPYFRPELLEYGNIAKLTNGSSGKAADGTTKKPA
jgi:hypothetical protein